MYFFCLNQLNLSKYTTLEHEQHNLSPENCLLEIKASTFEGPFILNQTSNRIFAYENGLKRQNFVMIYIFKNSLKK